MYGVSIMKSRIIYSFAIAAFTLGFSISSVASDFVYQCNGSNGEVTLQDQPCKPNMKEQIIKISTSSTVSHDGLRPLELAMLERNHELDKMRKEHEYFMKEQNSLVQAKYQSKRRMFDHKLKSFLFYGSRMDYPWSNGYPFGKVGHNHGGAIAGFGAPGTFGNNTTTNTASDQVVTSNDSATNVGVVNTGSGTVGSGTGGSGLTINVNT